MAQNRYQIVLFSAAIVAAGATFGVHRVLKAAQESNRVPTVPVVVAAQDLVEGARVEQLGVSVVQWPAASVPAGAYAVADSVVGRVTRIPVFKGEALVPGRLAPPGTGPGLEVKITPGKRAMAVKINDVTGIAGLIQPNSRVDVLVTLKDENGTGANNRQHAKVFMSNMRVLSVGTKVERGSDGEAIQATVAALEVTPDESERLAVAMNQGTIQLVLRGYGDPDSIKTRGATSVDVMTQLGGAPRAPAPAPARSAAPPRRAAAPPAARRRGRAAAPATRRGAAADAAPRLRGRPDLPRRESDAAEARTSRQHGSAPNPPVTPTRGRARAAPLTSARSSARPAAPAAPCPGTSPRTSPLLVLLPHRPESLLAAQVFRPATPRRVAGHPVAGGRRRGARTSSGGAGLGHTPGAAGDPHRVGIGPVVSRHPPRSHHPRLRGQPRGGRRGRGGRARRRGERQDGR
jgi:pilus assembly protein CpaB